MANDRVGGNGISESRSVIAGIAAFVLLVVALSAAVLTATLVAVVFVPLGLLLMPVAMLVLRPLLRRHRPPGEPAARPRVVVVAPPYGIAVRHLPRPIVAPPAAIEPPAAERREAA